MTLATTTQPCDGALLAAWLDQRDEAAWALLTERHTPIAQAVAKKQGVRAADLDDVVQSVFMLLLKGQHLRGRDSLAGWVSISAKHLSLHALRAEARRARALTSLRPAPAPDHDLNAAEAPSLDSALSALPPQQRQALTLVYGEGLPPERVAEQMGVPVGTIGAWLSRGRKRLRKLLAPATAPAWCPPLPPGFSPIQPQLPVWEFLASPARFTHAFATTTAMTKFLFATFFVGVLASGGIATTSLIAADTTVQPPKAASSAVETDDQRTRLAALSLLVGLGQGQELFSEPTATTATTTAFRKNVHIILGAQPADGRFATDLSTHALALSALAEVLASQEPTDLGKSPRLALPGACAFLARAKVISKRFPDQPAIWRLPDGSVDWITTQQAAMAHASIQTLKPLGIPHEELFDQPLREWVLKQPESGDAAPHIAYIRVFFRQKSTYIPKPAKTGEMRYLAGILAFFRGEADYQAIVPPPYVDVAEPPAREEEAWNMLAMQIGLRLEISKRMRQQNPAPAPDTAKPNF